MHDFPTEEEIKIGRATMALQRELAEARAQIAAKDAALRRYDTIEALVDTRDRQLDEARAQIAAKDAALREALHYVEADQNAVAADIEYAIKAALAAPARETK